METLHVFDAITCFGLGLLLTGSIIEISCGCFFHFGSNFGRLDS